LSVSPRRFVAELDPRALNHAQIDGVVVFTFDGVDEAGKAAVGRRKRRAVSRVGSLLIIVIFTHGFTLSFERPL
jgi:hypothetical protein